MKALTLLTSLVVAIPVLAAEPGYSLATIETHCILKLVHDRRYQLTTAILESREEIFVNEARLNDMDRRLFSTINQTVDIDTEESYLARLRAALPEFAKSCARRTANAGQRPPPR